MFKVERLLCLIGAILGIGVFIFMLLVGLVFGVLGAIGGSGGLLALTSIAVAMALVSFIFGFVANSKLKKDEKSGGIMALVSTGLALIGCIVGFIWAFGWLLVPCIVLYLTAGIMVLVKKAPYAVPVE